MKTTMTLQNKVLERIRIEKLRPTPRKYFVARDIVLWCILGAFAAALALGFGMIIFGIRGADQLLFQELGLSTSQRLVYTIPFFWILATLAVALIAFVNYRNTRRGYKTTVRQFALFALLLAVALGSVIYALNITSYIDRAVAELPIYNAISPINTTLWHDPENGLLSGIIREKESDEDFMLSDRNDQLWHITGKMFSSEGLKFYTGDRVKLIGKMTDEFEFRAVEIRPFEDRPNREEE
jgi:hypothetical protein